MDLKLWENRKENGNYCSILGLYTGNGEMEATILGVLRLGSRAWREAWVEEVLT